MSKSLSFLAVFSVFLIFSSCGKHKNQNEKRTVFKYNESAGISSLDPAFAKDQSNIWAINQIYNGLVQLDDSLNIEPCIAKSWVISDSGITYTFTLRKDVYFHDLEMFKNIKRRVVASDFVYSFNRILDEKVASPGAWVLNNVKKTTNRFEFNALNDTTLIINLNEPFPPFLGLLSMQYCSVVPREVVEFYGKDFRKHPVGTGPFKLKLWKEDVKLVLTKNENYFEFDGKTRLPYLDAVSISFIKDKQSAVLEFIK
jgi:peptide/nickel transport system substrate-binding protein